MRKYASHPNLLTCSAKRYDITKFHVKRGSGCFLAYASLALSVARYFALSMQFDKRPELKDLGRDSLASEVLVLSWLVCLYVPYHILGRGGDRPEPDITQCEMLGHKPTI